jgi:hypothetical protein
MTVEVEEYRSGILCETNYKACSMGTERRVTRCNLFVV